MAGYYTERQPLGLSDTQYYSTDSSGKQTTHEAYTGSNAWAGVGMASFASGVFENYMQLQASKAKAQSLEYQAGRYKYKAERSRMAAESAKTQTKLNNTILQEQYNETQSLQAVKFAMQGRTGATVENIIKQDQENLNWDKAFMELSGIIESTSLELDATGYEMDAAQASMASARTTKSGYRQATVGLLSTAAKSATIV